ncbi:DUF2141 domain-containing protein [Desulfovibrio inopinatus]|uniref:DUF2141 domain-containing protein n=1 Tax=Desulfovibrio inopinatus TaxID=102109 RepID=UPI00068867A8|nr:DUF2141 domain-containing protein [Desulfovibrio inopinatus]
MRSVLGILLVVFGLFPGMVHANGCTLHATVTYPETGDIRVALVTQEEYRNGLPPRYAHICVPTKSGPSVIDVEFKEIPPGIYALQSFQDVNGNGTLDEGMFGPSEPWGFYRPSRPAMRAPHFDEISFEVKNNMRGLPIHLED